MSRILIIDDDKDLLHLVKSFLRKEGFEVHAYSTWEAGWRGIKNYNPQLILLDVFLTGIDGLDVCKKLKSTHFTRHIPILVLSSFPNIAESAIYEFGADDFIAKPFQVTEVVRKINNTLSRKNISA